jgi:ubiquinone/menaquinone biosynthesis C-methylase UbiE
VNPSDREAERLREAYGRRATDESRLVTNAGQRALVTERDLAVRDALRRLPGGVETLLEIGCGAGCVVADLVAEGFARHGTGIDLLPERIEMARASHAGIDYVVGNAGRLPFEDDAFDAVIALTVLSSVPPGAARAAILAECARVLRPQGAFIWYDMRRRNPWNHDVRPFTVQEARGGLPGFRVTTRRLTLVPQLARRLGRATDRLYPLLVALPLLRTHLVGVARKP